MRDIKSIPIPARMQHLRRDARGYPIFYMALVDKHGEPHFTVNEETARQKCIIEERCSVCGGKLHRGRWFLGGPLSAFHDRGCYLDPPMHAECMHYACVVCPYLTMPKWSAYISGKTIPKDDPTPTGIDPAALDQDRPEIFVAVMASGQRKIMGKIGYQGAKIDFVQYVKPARPYLRVEFWRHGQRIDYAQALEHMPDQHHQALGEYIAKHGPVSRKLVGA